MTQGSNWRVDKLVEKSIPVPGSQPITSFIPHMRNDRGATLVRLGAGRERQEIFLYHDRDISFEFTALRYDGSETRSITDTYSVFLIEPFRTPGPTVSKDKIDRIKRDLDEALRIYPPLFPSDKIEVKDVIFL